MFDWEDQELAIIWGEADDHIVPYPDERERKSQPYFVYNDNNETHEEPANSKLSEQNPTATRTELHGGNPESNGDSSIVASDPEFNCIGKEVDLEKGSKISKDNNEVGELNDIISNSWADIGSFDDLDRIFSSLDGNWLPPDINLQTFDSQSFQDKSNSYSSSVLDHENTRNQHTTNPYFPAYSYGADDEHHHVSIEISTETLMKSQKLTPKEKVEKLRKRHQIQALLGIKKQQQQLSSENNKVLHFARDDLECEENMGTICDSGSPLYQLQNAVNELDTNIRVCIRDSLSRLAQNAMQRNYASDFEANILKENISDQERFMEISSAETDTNCIDRAVAHLLFHHPLKSTSGLAMNTSNSMPLSFVINEPKPEDTP